MLVVDNNVSRHTYNDSSDRSRTYLTMWYMKYSCSLSEQCFNLGYLAYEKSADGDSVVIS